MIFLRKGSFSVSRTTSARGKKASSVIASSMSNKPIEKSSPNEFMSSLQVIGTHFMDDIEKSFTGMLVSCGIEKSYKDALFFEETALG
mmetsp:Transcript_3076/g.4098  ORF Transcript_3076/g.4098 Transcript_3076/m.4098 type:complete len:88 (-) Transcript_3076:1197-1460(-)